MKEREEERLCKERIKEGIRRKDVVTVNWGDNSV